MSTSTPKLSLSMKTRITLSILVAAIGIMTLTSSCGHRQNPKFQVYRAVRIYNSYDSTKVIMGDPEPVYLTGADTMVYGPGDTIMVTAEGLVDRSEKPDHEVILGTLKGNTTLGTAD